MNDRQRDIVDAAVDHVMELVHDHSGKREDLSKALHQLAIDVLRPPALETTQETRLVRRSPAAGEVLPRAQRATWAREETVHDVPPLEIGK